MPTEKKEKKRILTLFGGPTGVGFVGAASAEIEVRYRG